MSEAFDETVFDAPDPDPAPGPDKAPAASEAPKAPEPRDQIAEAARKAGWTGSKDDWKGDPAEWLDAPEFILKAVGDVLPSMRKSLEDRDATIKDLKAAVGKAIQQAGKAEERAYAKARADLQAELEQYAKAGDVANVKSVTEDIVALEREGPPTATPAAPEIPPEMQSWLGENPWYGKDKALTAACQAMGDEVFAEGYTGKAQIKEVDRRLREEFPAKFAPPTNPNRSLPGAVEGGGNARVRGGKTFADLPKEAQDMCLDLMKMSKAVNKDNYAREYFAEEKAR